MTKSNNKQLILGFTGGIGRAVAVALTKRNIPVVALVRNTEKAAGYAAGIEGLELIEGDASNAGDVERAMRDVKVVHYCLNVPYPIWEKEAVNLLSLCLSAAVKCGVKVVFPGNVYVYGHAQYNPVDEKHPHAAHTSKGMVRIRMEEMLAGYRKEHGLDYAIIRMPDFYGPFVINTFSEQLYVNALAGRKLQWIGDLDVEIELIYIEDAGEAMVGATLDEEFTGTDCNVPGVSVTTARTYLQEIIRQAGTKSGITTLNSNVLFSLIGLFSPIVREVKEMLYLKREKLILDGRKFENELGKLPSTSYEAGVGATLKWAKQHFNH
jgi:nucleoside-diphosphate-sugar epimerase